MSHTRRGWRRKSTAQRRLERRAWLALVPWVSGRVRYVGRRHEARITR